MSSAVTLYSHQLKAVRELSNGKILWGGVGSGKSLTAVAYYMEKEAPKDVYVITTAKKRDSLDWDREFAKFGVGTRSDATVAGTLTVDSWNNLGRFRNVEGAFFIFDEQRLVGSGSWSKIFLLIARRNAWILLSATPGDTWLDYVPVFVANGFYKNRTEFKREHVIYNAFTKFPKVDRYVGVGKLLRLRKSITVDMPFTKHTIRKTTDVEVAYDFDLFRRVVKERWHVYENRPLRTASELFSVMRKVVNSSPSRLEKVRELLKVHPKLIVFYNFDYELYMLRALLEGVGSDTTTNAQKSSLEAWSGGESTLPFESTSNGLTRSSVDLTKSSGTALKGTKRRSLSTSNPPTLTGTKANRELSGISTPTGPWKRQGESFTYEPSSDVQLVEGLGQTKILTTTSPILVAPAVAASSERNSQCQTHSPACTTSSAMDTTVSLAKDSSIVPAAAQILPNQNFLGENSTNLTSTTTFGSEFQVAEWNGHKHEPIPKTERWVYLVQYVAGSEAWECTETNAMCFYSLPYSYKIWHQAHGRTDRLDTPFQTLYYYILKSEAIIDQIIWKSLMNKKSFNEAKFIGHFNTD